MYIENYYFLIPKKYNSSQDKTQSWHEGIFVYFNTSFTFTFQKYFKKEVLINIYFHSLRPGKYSCPFRLRNSDVFAIAPGNWTAFSSSYNTDGSTSSRYPCFSRLNSCDRYSCFSAVLLSDSSTIRSLKEISLATLREDQLLILIQLHKRCRKIAKKVK